MSTLRTGLMLWPGPALCEHSHYPTARLIKLVVCLVQNVRCGVQQALSRWSCWQVLHAVLCCVVRL